MPCEYLPQLDWRNFSDRLAANLHQLVLLLLLLVHRTRGDLVFLPDLNALSGLQIERAGLDVVGIVPLIHVTYYAVGTLTGLRVNVSFLHILYVP